MIYITEVQHVDGKWYELDRDPTIEAAETSKRWFARPKGYPGRPLRIRQLDEPFLTGIARPKIPPRGWAKKMRRARSLIRGTSTSLL